MKHILPVLLVAGLLFSGCRSGRSVADKYYLIAFDKAQTDSQANTDETVDQSCYIAPVWVHPAFSSHQIAIRSNTHEISYFSFNEWAVRPAAGFEELLQEYFNEYAVFKNVAFSESIPHADLRLETKVSRLELLEKGKTFAAHLQLEFLLFDQMSNELLLRFESGEQRELETKSLNEFAAVTGVLFTEALFALSQEVRTTLIKE